MKADGTASGFDSLWQRFMNRLVRETDVERYQKRDLRAVVASESDSLQGMPANGWGTRIPLSHSASTGGNRCV